MTEFKNENLTGARFEDVYLTDARFRDVDLTNARFHLVTLTGVRIRGAALIDVDISGEIENLRVNGVDVVPLVEAELNRRYPGRMKMRPTDGDGFREAWDLLERLWQETVERARGMGSGTAARTGRWGVVVHRDVAPSRFRDRRLGEARVPGGTVTLGPAGPAARRHARHRRRPPRPRGPAVAG